MTISDTEPRAAATAARARAGAPAAPVVQAQRTVEDRRHRARSTATRSGSRSTTACAVRERIENIYSKGGFASIDPTDLHGRFRVWGLYTQRKPGIDGGRTATLEPHELEDEYFMLRVRIDGGQLTTEQLRVIAGISTEFGRDTADLTDRQNIQLHWIRGRGRARDLAPPRSRRPRHHRGVRRRAARRPRLAGRRHRRRRAHRPDPADRRDHLAASSATSRSRTCPASSSRRSPGTRARTSCTRSTTSRSSRSSTPSSASATTCGSAAASRRPRASASASASSSRPSRWRMPGTASRRSSATTATGACATRRA